RWPTYSDNATVRLRDRVARNMGGGVRLGESMKNPQCDGRFMTIAEAINRRARMNRAYVNVVWAPSEASLGARLGDPRMRRGRRRRAARRHPRGHMQALPR